ncbi:hypothetical protein HAX54_033938, partial [Datura stramonium]|nr:hypothetical protein [Datura stramonium]
VQTSGGPCGGCILSDVSNLSLPKWPLSLETGFLLRHLADMLEHPFSLQHLLHLDFPNYNRGKIQQVGKCPLSFTWTFSRSSSGYHQRGCGYRSLVKEHFKDLYQEFKSVLSFPEYSRGLGMVSPMRLAIGAPHPASSGKSSQSSSSVGLLKNRRRIDVGVSITWSGVSHPRNSARVIRN